MPNGVGWSGCEVKQLSGKLARAFLVLPSCQHCHSALVTIGGALTAVEGVTGLDIHYFRETQNN